MRAKVDTRGVGVYTFHQVAKMNKKIFISILVLPVFFWAILCCCLERFAAAASSSAAECCHSRTDSHQLGHPAGHGNHSPSTNGCHCQKSAGLSFGFSAVSSVPESVNFQRYNPIASGLLESMLMDHLSLKSGDHHFCLLGKLFSDPACLRHSVLRI